MHRIKLNRRREIEQDILIGSGIAADAGNEAARKDIGEKPFIITSARVGGYYAPVVERSFGGAGLGECCVKTFADDSGEDPGSMRTAEYLYAKLAEFDSGPGRVFVVGLGGRTVERLAGFVAATYRGGVPWVFIPTTLSAQASCGLGNRAGVNIEGVRDAAGVYYPPVLTVAELDFLSTLEYGSLNSGMTHMARHAIIRDASLFSGIEEQRPGSSAFGGESAEQLVVASVRARAAVLGDDIRPGAETEMLLELGRAFARAIEYVVREARHENEALKLGIIAAAKVGTYRGFEVREAERIEKLFLFADSLPKIVKEDVEEILQALKMRSTLPGDKLEFAVPRRLGEAFVARDITCEEAGRALRELSEKLFP